MSLVHRCDLCKAIYEPYANDITNPITDCTISGVNSFIFAQVTKDLNTRSCKGKHIDICPECLDSLVEWMEGRVA